jgi:hypothetical protein
MLKSSSLCLYSSNLGTFWLKIEQFWPFVEISIFSNGGHLGYRTALTDSILKGTTQGSFQQSLVEIGSVVSEKIFINFIPLFSIFSLAAILVGSRDQRTQFWKGAIHKSLVAIGPVVSEEKIFM